VAGGGRLAESSPAHAKTALPGTKQNGKKFQKKERSKRISPSCSKRKERRRRRRSTARAELRLGFLVRRCATRERARVSGAVWRGAREVPFIGLGGEEEGALEPVDGH
jgi:hypothetical protein